MFVFTISEGRPKEKERSAGLLQASPAVSCSGSHSLSAGHRVLARFSPLFLFLPRIVRQFCAVSCCLRCTRRDLRFPSCSPPLASTVFCIFTSDSGVISTQLKS